MNQNLINRMVEDIRGLYRSDSEKAAFFIESYLDQHLKESPEQDPNEILGALLETFGPMSTPSDPQAPMEDESLSKVFSLLLGREVTQADLSSKDVLRRLADSINTVFDTLNQLIKVINATLSTDDKEDKTIRYMIESHLEKGSQTKSLEVYLGQIQKAFLTTQQAFKNAAYAKVKEILDELDPEKISAGSGGIKFGPLRKAENFDTYERKYQTCRKWFESGRFMEAFLQEFEKNCRKLTI